MNKVYTTHDIEKDDSSTTTQSTKKIPLAITSTRRCPLDRLQTNLVDSYITTGGLCETAFLELNDPTMTMSLDTNFIEFRQPQPIHTNHHHQIQQQLQHQQSQQQQLPIFSSSYESGIATSEMDLYGSSCKPSKCYLSDTSDFVGVSSLDILQGVRQGESMEFKFFFG